MTTATLPARTPPGAGCFRSFACSRLQYSTSKRSSAPEGRVLPDVTGDLHHVDRVLVDVRGRVGLRAAGADGDDAEPRDEHYRGARVEAGQRGALRGAHAVEVRLVVGAVAGDGAADRLAHGARVGGKRAEQHRPRLRANDVVGRGRAASGQRAEVPAGDERARPLSVAEREHRSRLLGEAAGLREHTAERRQERRRERARGRLNQMDARRVGAVGRVALRAGHGSDHALVARLRGLAEREDAVSVEHHHRRGLPLGDGRVPRLLARASEPEAWHHVRHPHEPAREHLAAHALGLGLIDQREDRVGVCVIDELGGQDRVEQRLDARGRGAGVEEREAKSVDHGLIGEGGKARERAEGVEPARGVPRGLDRREVPAGALHAQDVDGLPEERDRARLHRGVAAAVQHQARLPAEEARGVRAHRDVASELGALVLERCGDRALGVLGSVERVHGGPPTPRGDARPSFDAQRGPGTTPARTPAAPR